MPKEASGPRLPADQVPAVSPPPSLVFPQPPAKLEALIGLHKGSLTASAPLHALNPTPTLGAPAKGKALPVSARYLKKNNKTTLKRGSRALKRRAPGGCRPRFAALGRGAPLWRRPVRAPHGLGPAGKEAGGLAPVT